MNALHAIRKRRRPLVAQVLGVLGIVWLGSAFQPCLMAAEMDMTGPCPHCPAPAAGDCESAVPMSCGHLDQLDHDGRGPGSKILKKQLAQSALPPASFPVQLRGTARGCATGPPPGPAAGADRPPLNVLYCVYLN